VTESDKSDLLVALPLRYPFSGRFAGGSFFIVPLNFLKGCVIRSEKALIKFIEIVSQQFSGQTE